MTAAMRKGEINARAAALVMIGMTAFTINDSMVKLLGAAMPVGQLLALRGLITIAIFLLVLPLIGERPHRPDRWTLLRAAIDTGVAFSFVTALTLGTLAAVTTTVFVAPVILTLLAATVLKEKVGPRRWAAVLAGFAGVAIAANPSTDGIDLAVLLALLTAFLSAVRDLVIRRIRPATNTGTIALTSMIAVTCCGLASAPHGWIWPQPGDLWLLLGAAIGVAIAFFCLVAGLRLGEFSFLAPFRYTSIPVAMLLSVLVFGEVPAWTTILGAVIIIASGLFIFLRERQLERETA